MRSHIKLLTVVVTILAPLGLAVPAEQALSQAPEQVPEVSAPATPSEPSFAPDRVLVKTKEDATTEDVDAVNRKNNARIEKKIPRTRVNVVKLPKDLPVEEAVKRYEASPNVEYAEPDYKIYPTQSSPTPDDPSYSKLYNLNNTGRRGSTANADVDGPEAWSVTTGDTNTVVAVIDTGIDINHPDLKDNIWVNPGESGDGKETNGVDDDRNGYKDDVHGWDFVNDDNSVFDNAANDSHGTHVAGTIAAEGNNSLGVVGVNWQSKVMSAKFLGPNGGYTSDFVEALNYAVAEGATISNNSWGGGDFSYTTRDAIRAADTKGHLFVASAGNDGRDTDAIAHYPSSYDSSNIIAVAATDRKDSLAGFSNYGANSVDLAAPGVSILSTIPNNKYALYYGTSMAAPHVSGVAALLKSNSPGLDDNKIKDRILSTVDPRAGLQGTTFSGGRLSAARALGVNTAPTIAPKNVSTIRTRRPPVRTISAAVRDDEKDLAAADIEFYVDGQQVTTFAYDQATDVLTYPTRLSFGRHTFEVVAKDGQGPDTSRTWYLRVIHSR